MTPTNKTAEQEVNSFLGLLIINLMLAALAIGLGMSIIIDPATKFLTGVPAEPWETLYRASQILFGMVSFGLGFSWLLTTAPVIGGVGHIHQALMDLKAAPDDTGLTQLYIRLLSFYREKYPTVQRMMLFGRAGGLLFILAGLVNAVIGIAQGSGYGFAGSLAVIGVGIGCLSFTRRFTRHATVWDQRIAQSKQAEDSLGQYLSGETP